MKSYISDIDGGNTMLKEMFFWTALALGALALKLHVLGKLF